MVSTCSTNIKDEKSIHSFRSESPKERRPLVRLRRRLEDNIKMNLEGVEYYGVD
jgi:hypothetical protein